MQKYLPLKSVIQTVRNDITTAHLWLEESISGDKYVDLDTDVFNKLKVVEYKDYIEKSEASLREKEDKYFYKELMLIDKKIDTLYILAEKRLQDIKEHKIGSNLDQIFDKEFKEITSLLLSLNNSIDDKLLKEIDQKENYLILVLTLFLFANIIVFLFLYWYKNQRDKYEQMIYSEKEKALVTLISIGDAVITTDEKGYITFLNPIAEKLTEYTNEESKGKYIDEVFNIINESTKDRIESPIKKVLKERKILGLPDNTALISKNNNIYSIEDSVSPIRNNKKIIGTILVFRDVTIQNKVREKLNENEKLLIQQSKMAAMGEMLENIAHQWRQPLSIISTSATGIKLKKEVNDLDDKFLFDSVALINNSAQYLSKTIEDFREFIKPGREKEEFTLDGVYHRTISLINSKLEHNDIKIVENISSLKIEGFENELVQVFMNLINNSIDALGKKKGKKIIFIEIIKEKEHACIKFRDNAGGVLKEIIPRIFEPYFTTKYNSQGTGIGLYMTEEIIVKHMHGKISVENKTFKYENEIYIGAEFLIELKCLV
tara:strand:+ start:3071 stop:4708 length:1638 start_codon:yes stop_codon:yes gene_type:complete